MKILITAPSFAKNNPEPLEMLRAKGYNIVRNETGRAYTKKEMCGLLADADGVILGVDPCDAEVIAAAPRLKAISRYGVGMNNIDIAAAQARGIAVCNAAGANAAAVADTAMTLLLAVSKKLLLLNDAVRSLCFDEVETYEANGKTLGLLGFGNIGAQVAKRAAGFDMRVLAFDVARNEECAAARGVTFVDTLGELLRSSDYVSLHLPLLPETYHIIGEKELALMKPRSVLINTARGGLVDEKALAKALASGALLGAGLDVFEEEPPAANNPLLQLRNCIMTPHAAADTYEATHLVSIAAARNLIAALGESQ